MMIIMVSRFWAVLSGWLVDTFESSWPNKSAQSLQGQPGASEHAVAFMCFCKVINYYCYAKWDPFSICKRFANAATQRAFRLWG